MKKLKYFLLAAIGLGLVAAGLAGCDKGEGDGYDPANDHRGRVAGVYPVKVTVPMNGNFYPEMSIAKEGNHALKASASADIPGMGKMSIDLTLTDLKEYNDEGGQSVTGYYFKVAEQNIDIAGLRLKVTGKGTYDGYDGKIYKNAEIAFIFLEAAAGQVNVKIETGVYVDKRADVTGVYPVKITGLPVVGEVETDVTVEVEGDNALMASGSADTTLGTMSLSNPLSDVLEYEESAFPDATAYYFKVEEREYSLGGLTQTMAGTGKYNGYDGKIYSNGTELFINLEIGNKFYTVDMTTFKGE